MGEQTRQWQPEVQKLRGVAILLVVVTHLIMTSYQSSAGRAVLYGTLGATWTFVFIAGYLTAHLREQYTYRTYLESKLRNVLLPYLVVASLIIASGLSVDPIDSIAELATAFLLGAPISGPLWFVPMIALFFIGFPFYRAICNYPRTLLAVAALALGFAGMLGRPEPSEGPLINFMYFQSAFLFGLAWRVFREEFHVFVARYRVVIVIALVIGAASLGEAGGTYVFERVTFSVVPLTMLLMHYLLEESPLDPVWAWLATRSFGIFFLHGLFSDHLPDILGKDHNVFVGLALGLTVTAVCGLAVSLVRRLAGRRSRLLVGS